MYLLLAGDADVLSEIVALFTLTDETKTVIESIVKGCVRYVLFCMSKR